MKRSERLVDMTSYLMARPHTLIALPFFAERYDVAKSSISEDLGIVKHTLAKHKNGILETVAGASGGVRYIPFVGRKIANDILVNLSKKIDDSHRILPGGFVYLSDILGNPQNLRQIGELIATKFAFEDIDAVMTVETKGIPLAAAVSEFMNVPFVIVRRKAKITEGSTISANYVASSSKRIEKMELAKRSLTPNSRVLIVDDFMKGGGTLTGMMELVKEFDCEVAGMAVFCETRSKEQKVIKDYISLIDIEEVNVEKKTIKVHPGNFLMKTDLEVF